MAFSIINQECNCLPANADFTGIGALSLAEFYSVMVIHYPMIHSPVYKDK